MPQAPPGEQAQTPQTNSPSSQNPALLGGNSRRNLITLAAVALVVSFFLPWAQFLGANLSGLDIQRNFESYRLVWLLPVCAALTFFASAAGFGTSLPRRVAGLVPFAILLYSLNKFGHDVWQLIAVGGWLALATGALLVIIPDPLKPQPKL